MFESNKLYNESGFKKEDDAKQFIQSIQGKIAKIANLKKSKQKENAPLLFNLAEIQNQCTKRFKIKPDETLEIIQNLYEKKLVTYPRTDARVLSTAVAKEITKNLNGIARGYKDEEVQGYIRKMVDEKYSTNIIKTKYVNDSKITDHYAIIPTGQGYENYNNLPELHKKVYKVIVSRFLAIFYPPAEYNKIQVTVEIEDEKTIETFNCSGKVCINKGFLEILKPEEKKSTKNGEKVDNSQEEGKQNDLEILKNLKKGQEVEIRNFELKEAETSPPTRYNSGSIILAMENAGKLIEEEELREQIKGAGIGTSATRAEIMKKLEKIKYIEINTKTQIITPTKKGELIYDIVYQSMPDMLNPKLTASWEKGLDMVAKKEIEPKEFMGKLEKYIYSKFDRLVVKI
jgi:DNA topoisomerase-3